jgi:hypothetical protein
MPVTESQAHALAAITVACRPHGARRWDEPGVVAAIGHVQRLALADVAMACIRAASDRSLNTPAAIGNTQSSAWRERLAEAPPVDPKRKRYCRTHSMEINILGVCSGCASDQLAGDAPTIQPTEGTDP